MIIGVPREVMDHEYRVGLTPSGVRQLVAEGKEVRVEKGAGEGSGFSDEDYKKAGGQILKERDVLFRDADIIIKVKEPLLDECKLFHPGQVLFSYLHLAAHPSETRLLLEKKITAIGFETLSLADGSFPLLKPMSEIAGKLAVQVGLFYLQKSSGGKGILLSGVPGVEKGRVTILGSGTVGKNAVSLAVGLGAQVTVLGQDADQLRELDSLYPGRIETLYAHEDNIIDRLTKSDLSIGAVLLPGGHAPRLVSRSIVSQMKKGSVIVDVSIDQGGCFETSRITTHSDPVYQVDGVTHYCVPNMPGGVPQTSTLALCNVTLPYLIKLSSQNIEQTLKEDASFRRGLNLYQGAVTHAGLAEALGEPLEDIDSLLKI